MNTNAFYQFLVFVAKAIKVAHNDGECTIDHPSIEEACECINQGHFDLVQDILDWEEDPIDKEDNMKQHINVRPIVGIEGNVIKVQPRSIRVDYLPGENELISVKEVLQSFLTKDEFMGYTGIWGDKILVVTGEKAFLSKNAKIVSQKKKEEVSQKTGSWEVQYVYGVIHTTDGKIKITRAGKKFPKSGTWAQMEELTKNALERNANQVGVVFRGNGQVLWGTREGLVQR